MDTTAELDATISDLVQVRKGILAADESAPTIARRFAAICQLEGFVPIVEPEVLIDGDHTIARSAAVIEAVLHAVLHALHRHKVILECIVLKHSIRPGGGILRMQPRRNRHCTSVLFSTVPHGQVNTVPPWKRKR